MNELISIIVPIFNQELYMDKTVESLIFQTYSNIEILLIDDGSTDKSVQKCDYYAEKYTQVKSLHILNSGLSYARKYGVDHATGTYIMFVDGDDWIDSDCIEIMYNEMKESNVEAICCGYVREYNSNSFNTSIFNDTVTFKGDDYFRYFYRKLYGLLGEELKFPEKIDSLVSVCMKLYPSWILKNADYIDTNKVGSCEDALLNMTSLINISSIKYINRYLYHYRKEDKNSLSHLFREKLDEQWDLLYKYMESYILKYNLSDIYKEALSNRRALNIIGYGLMLVSAEDLSILNMSRKLKKVLKKEKYCVAINKLDRRFFSFKWKVFFLLCKNKNSFLLVLMFKSINLLKRYKSK